MEPLCEFCGVARAAVYCKPDSARLCMDCDGIVHSANSLSRRHPRSFLCDKCNFDSATVRCNEFKQILCQACDLNSYDCMVLGHRHQPLNFYTGCPSNTEFSKLLSHVFDANSSCGGWESVTTLLKNDTSKHLEQPDKGGSSGLVSDKLDEVVEQCVKFEPWTGQSSIIPTKPNHTQYGKDPAFFFPQDSNQQKVVTSTHFG